MLMDFLHTEKLKRSAERKLIKMLELRQQEIAELKHTISSSIRQLENLVGREGTKDFLKDYPLPF